MSDSAISRVIGAITVVLGIMVTSVPHYVFPITIMVAAIITVTARGKYSG